LFGVFQVEALAIRDKSVSPVLAIAWVACGLSAAAAIDSRLFKHVARYLTSYENHTYQPDHEAHLVAKRFAFEAVNQFGPVRDPASSQPRERVRRARGDGVFARPHRLDAVDAVGQRVYAPRGDGVVTRPRRHDAVDARPRRHDHTHRSPSPSSSRRASSADVLLVIVSRTPKS
jgi:hypothetical protein